MLKLRNISKIYKTGKKNEIKALKNINLTLPNKGLIFLIGESGSGKSTLLNLMGLLDKPTTGELFFNGQNVNQLKKHEVDFYRNTYLGFIFQDYNLIENYNVLQNLELSLQLQKKKVKLNDIERILEVVGLKGYSKRKINELSGGEKQRIAIARALIKDPELILADEPTGNLDSYNSEQIFNLLKEISEDKLVIVVSHNISLAQAYGDRIIKLQDGNIISDDTKENLTYVNTNVDIIKSKLPLGSAFNLSFTNLKKKKISLAIMTIIITCCLSVFGFVYLLTNFDINRTHAETMIREKEKRIEIEKQIPGKKFTTLSAVRMFTKEDVDKVVSDIKEDYVKVSLAVENNTHLMINLGRESKNINAYYATFGDINVHFLEYSNSRLDNLSLIGNKPVNAHEIVISKITADYIINSGVEVLEYDDVLKQETTKEYIPDSYEELINSKKKIALGSTYVIISGILDDDMSKYEELKNISLDEIEVKPNKLYDELRDKYSSRFEDVIVNNNFFNTMDFTKNNQIYNDLYRVVIHKDGEEIYPYVMPSILDKEIEIFNGYEMEKVSNIQDNEIIINELVIDNLFNNEFSNRYMEEVKKHHNEDIDTQELKNKILIDFIKEKNLIGQTIKFDLVDLYNRVNEERNTSYELTIKGVYLEDIFYYYVPTKEFQKYMRDNEETQKIYFDIDNEKEIVRILDKYNSKEDLVAKTVFTSTIDKVSKTVNYVSKIAEKVLIAILVFTIVLFTFFIISSVSRNKKDIGILRAMGAKISDIYKIYYLEGFIVGMIAYLLAIGIVYYSTFVANSLISQNLFASIEPVIFNYHLIYILLILVILIVTISFIIPILKIGKTKPIDIIYNK